MIKRYSFYIIFAIFFLKGFALKSQLQIEIVGSSSAALNTPFDVDVHVADFDMLYSSQFAVAWDSLVLRVDSVLNISTELSLLSRESITLPSETVKGTKGRANVSWNAGVPQTLPDDHRLFTLRFSVVGEECDETTMTITDPEGLFIEVIDSNISDIGAESNEVPIQIPGVGCVIDPPGEDIELVFGEITADPGSSFCIPFTVNNFDSIEACQGSFMWDPTVIQFTGVQNFGLMGLSEGLFNTAIAVDGMLSFLWFDGSGTNPASIPDGGTVFEICFDAIGSNGDMTVIKATDSPVMFQLSGPPTGIRPFVVEEGKITLGGPPPPRDVFSIIAEDKVISITDTEVCVDFSTNKFIGIVGMQYTMEWDDSILNYDRVEAVDSRFANSFQLNGTDQLGYVWTDANGVGFDIPDGTVIYRVCFDVIGDCSNSNGQSLISDISFVGQPGVPIEITDDNFAALDPSDVELIDGSVTIPCGISCSATVTDVRCFGDSNGAINLTILGGTSPYSVLWVPNGTPQNGVDSSTLLVGQGAGTYSPTVTDASGSTQVCGSYTIEQPDELVLTVTVNGTAVNATTTGGNGSVTITYSPLLATPPLPGTYTATATDSRGCMDTVTFEILGTCNVMISNVTIFSTSCGNDGVIEITCSGGSGQYDLLSQPDIQINQTTGRAMNVAAGTYQITCRDSNDPTCFEVQNVTVLAGTPPTLNASVTNIQDASCDGSEGSFDVSASGGCPPYSVSIVTSTGIESPYMNGNTYPAGDYICRFRDIGGNLVEIPVTIGLSSGEPISIVDITESPSPCTGMNGQATFEIAGGCGDPECQVSIGGGAPQPCSLISSGTNLFTGDFPIGNHTITFSDPMSGTSATMPFNIVVSPNGLSVSVNSITSSSIDIDVSGGTGSYVYQWFFGGAIVATTQDLTGLTEAGPYSVIVQDSNGCSTSLEVTVTPVGTFGLNVNPVETPFGGFATPCADGDCLGMITGIISGNNPPFTITLTDSGANSADYTFDSTGNFAIDGLCAESYDIEGRDNLGTIVPVPNTFIVTSPQPIEIGADPLDLVCPDAGDNNGSILATATGGVGNYTLNWTPDQLNDPFPAFMVEDLGPGMYTLNVTDDNMCEASFTFDLLTTCTDEDCFEGRRVITPNGDGANESLTITCAQSAQISIFDRYSRLVYNSSSYSNDWRGVDSDNIDLPQGAYYWVLRTATDTYKGTVTLLRD